MNHILFWYGGKSHHGAYIGAKICREKKSNMAAWPRAYKNAERYKSKTEKDNFAVFSFINTSQVTLLLVEKSQIGFDL